MIPSEYTDRVALTNDATRQHIERVRNLLNDAVRELLARGEKHDQSKLKDPEVSTFVEYTPKLKDSTYGSDEYKGYLEAMKPALEHHYHYNRHHPEHFGARGVNGMNLIDLLEMFCDWKAAGERHADGDIYHSIEHNPVVQQLGDKDNCRTDREQDLTEPLEEPNPG